MAASGLRQAAQQAGSTGWRTLVPALHAEHVPDRGSGEIAFDAKGDVNDPKYSIYRYQNGKYGEM